MNQLPKGGGVQHTTAPTTPAKSTGRTVNRTRLEKLSDEMLNRKIGSVKSKIARKEDAAQKKIAVIKQKVTDYAQFKEDECKVAKEIIEARKRMAPSSGPKEKAA